MARTILFFGDSNTRGAGVGIRARFASLLEEQLAASTGSAWQFAVAHAESDLRIFPGALESAVAAHSPDVVVLQCPNGPVTFWINYPGWIVALNTLPNTGFRWLLERYVRAAIKARPAAQRSRGAALYESLYLDRAYRWNISQWCPLRQIRRRCATRYGLIDKTTPERYVELLARLHDHIRRSRPRATLLLLGLLPLSEDYYPGQHRRAAAWNARLAAAFDRPDDGVFYVELQAHLSRMPARNLLLHDGRHLTAAAHRRVGEIVRPVLERAMRAAAHTPPHGDACA